MFLPPPRFNFLYTHDSQISSTLTGEQSRSEGNINITVGRWLHTEREREHTKKALNTLYTVSG